MKFGPLIKCNVMVLFKNHAENEAERLVPDLFCFFLKALHDSVSIYLDSPPFGLTSERLRLYVSTWTPFTIFTKRVCN